MANDLVTIIIPSYNRSRFLRDITLPSVIRQIYKPIECIVVDDGSTDDTSAVVEEFIGRDDIHIEYIRQKNKGQGAARNAAIKRARGKWILPLDSDDAILPDGVATLVSAAERESADIIWANTWRVRYKSKKILGIGGSTPSSVLLSKRIFDVYGLYDENREVLEDIDHLYRLQPFLENGSIKLVQIRTPTSIYFIHEGQSTNLRNPEYLLIKANAMLKKWEPLVSYSRQWRKNIGRWWRNKGSYEILMGRRKEGLRSLRHSFSFGFSLVTLILLSFALGGALIFRWGIIVPRHITERLSYKISEYKFMIKNFHNAKENKDQLSVLLKSSAS